MQYYIAANLGPAPYYIRVRCASGHGPRRASRKTCPRSPSAFLTVSNVDAQRTRRLLLSEPLHNVRCLLPAIHRLLELLVALKQHHVKNRHISNVAVALKHGAELGTQQRRRHVQRVQRQISGACVSHEQIKQNIPHGRSCGTVSAHDFERAQASSTPAKLSQDELGSSSCSRWSSRPSAGRCTRFRHVRVTWRAHTVTASLLACIQACLGTTLVRRRCMHQKQ